LSMARTITMAKCNNTGSKHNPITWWINMWSCRWLQEKQVNS
jgi:hypothetical protein